MVDTVAGNTGNNDLKASPAGSHLNGNQGNDILRGGRGDDIMTGGQGNDWMYGGDGGDTFRFFGTDTTSSGNLPTGVETDKIFDLDFSEGDALQFLAFSECEANTTVNSWEDLAQLVHDTNWAATENANGTLTLSYDFGGGVVQNIVITGGAAHFNAIPECA